MPSVLNIFVLSLFIFAYFKVVLLQFQKTFMKALYDNFLIYSYFKLIIRISRGLPEKNMLNIEEFFGSIIKKYIPMGV